MVLARRHIQRLWYPLPGHEAGIPSRSSAALPADELARRMPAEFWREVVDRVAAEVPDTLLLAEAFWLLEGYFVRTLGMHRVYNSAFMHMLRDEKNAGYQQVIRETVAFDARILGRYVNFMSNPDERSAIDQFGSHDKYFGVATLLATLPGLPMFGHGQVEGFSEQYGMEFRRPQRDETPDEGLVERHRREIFPLLRQRWRFAGASGFRQLTAFEGGHEVPDVFAYANRAEHGPADAGDRRSLVVYLNRYPRAHVRIPGVAEALGVGHAADGFLILRDHRSGLDFLREMGDLRAHGLELALDGYGCHVFVGFEEVSDPGWAGLAMRLGLGGVPDARLALRRLLEEPIRTAVSGILATRLAADAFLPAPDASPGRGADGSATDARGVPSGPSRTTVPDDLAAAAELEVACRRLAEAAGTAPPAPATLEEAIARLRSARSLRPRLVAQVVAGWALGELIGRIATPGDPGRTLAAFDAWEVAGGIGDLARRAGSSDAHAWRASELARGLLALPAGALRDAAAGPGLPIDVVRVARGPRRLWLERMAGSHLPVTGGLDRAARVTGRPRRAAGPSRWPIGRGCRARASRRSLGLPPGARSRRVDGSAGLSPIPGGPDRLGDLVADITTCRRCPRLVAWREEVARHRVARYRDQVYWGRPVPGFGDPGARLLLLGLAPAAHGGNRTGRVFTGDNPGGSGELLFTALHRAGFATRPRSLGPADDLRLEGAYIAAATRCAPPDNKPSTSERDACLPYLVRELRLLPRCPRRAGPGWLRLDGRTAGVRPAGAAQPRPGRASAMRPRPGWAATSCWAATTPASRTRSRDA